MKKLGRLFIVPLMLVVMAGCNNTQQVKAFVYADATYTEVSPTLVTIIEQKYRAGDLDDDDIDTAKRADLACKVALDVAQAAIIAGDNEALKAAMIEVVSNFETLKQIAGEAE